MNAHVHEAIRLLADAQLPVKVDDQPIYPSDADALAAAQVEATLALVEQQRIANLIALASYKHASGSRGYQHVLNKPIGEFDAALNDDVKEGLGL